MFQLAPETEAPAEMHMFYPGLRALNLAENATHNLHNTYPIRGAQVRDANAWAKYLNEALDRFGRDADVALAQHHWPVWGHARVHDFLSRQRDLYKYLHDQTVRLMNHGYKAIEIAERLALPRSQAATWHVRGYYGTLSHNARSVYQRYLGWYDANPANLNPLPPVERGRKYVEYMGGAAAVLARAREDFARGEYRFVAEALSHVVFADPSNAEARALGAAALEQLGYAAESATWRNAYLLGALELRQGVPAAAARAPVSPDIVRAMSLDLFFDYLAVRLNGDKAEGRRLVINWRFTDVDRGYVLNLEHSALTYLADRQRAHADATVTLERAVLDRLVLRELTLADAVERRLVAIEGDAAKVVELFGLLRRLHADVSDRRAAAGGLTRAQARQRLPVERHAMPRTVRRDGAAVLHPERLGDVAVQAEAVRFEVRAVRRGGQQMHAEVVGAVRGHRQVERFGQVADLHEDGHAAAVGDVGLRKGHAAGGDQRAELVQRVQVLAGRDRHAAFPHDPHVTRDIVGNRRLLQPHQVLVGQRPGRADRVVHAPAHVGVGHQREALAQMGPHRPHPLDVLVQ